MGTLWNQINSLHANQAEQNPAAPTHQNTHPYQSSPTPQELPTGSRLSVLTARPSSSSAASMRSSWSSLRCAFYSRLPSRWYGFQSAAWLGGTIFSTTCFTTPAADLCDRSFEIQIPLQYTRRSKIPSARSSDQKITSTLHHRRQGLPQVCVGSQGRGCAHVGEVPT